MRIKISVKDNLAVLKCDNCDKKFEAELSKGLLGIHLCFSCDQIYNPSEKEKKRIRSIIKKANDDHTEFLHNQHTRMKIFRMKSSGDKITDQETRKAFGDWL